MTKLRLKVDMHCASCAHNIQKTLKKIGVEDVAANPPLKLVKLEYDETKVSKEDIEKAINDIGYNVIGQ